MKTSIGNWVGWLSDKTDKNILLLRVLAERSSRDYAEKIFNRNLKALKALDQMRHKWLTYQLKHIGKTEEECWVMFPLKQERVVLSFGCPHCVPNCSNCLWVIVAKDLDKGLDNDDLYYYEYCVRALFN